MIDALSIDRPDADTEFRIDAPFDPTGDQPEAIEQLAEGFRHGYAAPEA